MPDMIPVGNTIIPPNPQQGMQTLSGLLGLQQQRQALQTGAYTQQTAAAEASQEQRKNAELQALAKFSANAIQDPTYRLPDGTLDVQKYQTGAMTVAPTYGAPVIGQQTSNVREAIGIRSAIQSLSAAQNKQITDGLSGLANIPGGATRTDLLNWKEQLTANNKDPAFARAIDNAMISLQPDPNGGYSGGAAKMAASLGGMSMQQPGQMDVGGTIQPTTTTTMGPEVGTVKPVGAPVAKTLTPGQEPGYVARISSLTGLGSGGAQDINQHYAGVQSEAQRAETFTGIARNVQDFAHKAITGTPEQRLNMMNGMLAFIGISPAQDAKTASDLLQKNMAQLNLQGNVATDFKAMVTQMAQPHMSMSADAIEKAAGQLIGQVQMKKAVGTALTPAYNHAQATGDQDLYRAQRDAISKISDARVWEFEHMTPQQQKAFRKNLSPQDDAELGQKYKAAKALGLLQ